MRIDRKLNLVVPIYDDADPPEGEDPKVIAYVHSTPLAAEIVDRYFMVLAQTFSAIFHKGLGSLGGPAVALRVLREVATNSGIWDDDKRTGTLGVEHGLVEEMRRLTNVLVPGDKGWTALPLTVAVQQGALSEDDQSEVENAIVFFTVSSAMLPRAVRRTMLGGAADLWGAQISQSTCTELKDSLTTSIARARSGENIHAPAKEDEHPATATKDGKPASVPR